MIEKHCILFFKPAGLYYIWMTPPVAFFCVTFFFLLFRLAASFVFFFFTAALIPDFMYRCVLVGLLLTFYFDCNNGRAPAAPALSFPAPATYSFPSWTVLLFDTSGGSLFHRVRTQRVHEVWWLVSGALSIFFILLSTLSWAALSWGVTDLWNAPLTDIS